MAYGNNNRGGYGNRQGGGSQGGGYNRGGGRSGSGRGGNFGGNGGNAGGADSKYVRSSFFDKHLIFEAEKQGDGPAPREKKDLEPGITEEITLTLSPQKTEQLMKKLQDAINDQAGDGGIRMTMYCQHKINQQDNSEFDGASILVVAKFPPKNQNGFEGKQASSGRKDYPDRGSQKGSSGAQGGGQTQSGNNYTENSGW